MRRLPPFVLLATVVALACGEGPAETNFAGYYTSLSLSSNRNPAAVGDTVTFTATVGFDVGPPRGLIYFYADQVVIPGCADLPPVNAVATCRTAGLAAGSRQIQVFFSGQQQYLGSMSPILVQVIN